MYNRCTWADSFINKSPRSQNTTTLCIEERAGSNDRQMCGKIILLGIISIVCVAMTSGKTDSLPNHEDDTNPLFLSVKQTGVTALAAGNPWLLMTVPL